MRGLRLKGGNYEGRYVIVDVQMDHDYPTIRQTLFDPYCRRGGTVLIRRQPDTIWRIDYQPADGEEAGEATREDMVRHSVAAVLREIGMTARGSWNGGRSVRPTRWRWTITATGGSSASATAPISCPSSGRAV